MTEESKRPLKVFLCHASDDKPAARNLYRRLIAEGIDAWLDEEKLIPGQDWQLEIPRAVREADVVVVCLSNRSVTKEGFIQKEIRFALDVAKEKPEGTIFLIPVRLEDCAVPEGLSHLQWMDFFSENGYERLMLSLEARAKRVRAIIEPLDESEIEQRLEELYIEGLAAFHTEDWDKAYARFRDFLRERPNHPQVSQKFEQVIRQRRLKAFYSQALEAQKIEDWQTVITVLEKLTSDAPDYKDAVALLETAQKEKQLLDLYNEARRLYRAEQWQAVAVVLAKIAAIDTNYPDTDRLKDTVNQKLAESARHAELNKLYGQAVREIDAGNWQSAYKLLKRIRKIQVGFLETEQLLTKVEQEIEKIKKPLLRRITRILFAVIVLGILSLLILGLWRWGLPVRIVLDKPTSVFATEKSSLGIDTPFSNRSVYVCKFDKSSQRYQIANNFWDCKSNTMLGWIRRQDIPEDFSINLVYRQQ